MAAGMVKHGKRHAACVLLLMALWYHPAFSRERNLPVIPYPAEVRMDVRGVYDMERSSWWIDPEADSLCVKAVERLPIKKVYGYEPVPEGLDDNEADHILGLCINDGDFSIAELSEDVAPAFMD